MSRRVSFFVFLVAVASIIATVTHFSGGSIEEVQVMSVKEVTPAADGGSAEDALRNVQAIVINLLRQASREYPVPYVREQLREVVRGVDDKSVVIATIFTTEPAYEHLYARFRKTPNGRPMIEYYLSAIARFSESLAKQLGTIESAVIDPLYMDWYVQITIHEWTHYKRGHRYNNGVTPEIHAQQESEAWANVFENVVYPAIQQGRFSHPLGEEVSYGYFCWLKASGDTEHPAWKAFVKLVAANGTIEDVEGCLPQQVTK